MKRWFTILLTGVVAFVLGFQLGFGQSQIFKPAIPTLPGLVNYLRSRTTPVDFGVVAQVWDRIQSHYVGAPISDRQLLNGVLKGLVAAMNDPYSAYLDPEIAKQFEEEIKGDIEGIGAEVGIKHNQLVVIAPLPDSPAGKAGLIAGDVILEIDGQSTSDLALDEAVSKLRGAAGSKVMVQAQTGTNDPRTMTIIREKIRIKSVTLSWTDGAAGQSQIAVVTISSFSQDSGRLFLTAVQDVVAKSPSGLILDLRNNPGGYLDQAVTIASQFIPDGPILIERFGDGHEKSYSASGGARLSGVPIVVLINGGSASASEILAGALRERQKAIIVGEHSFGKGSVQELESLPGGASLKLTIARWLMPNGTSIEPNGLAPNREVALTKDDYENNKDPQMDVALSLLRNQETKQ